LPDRSWIFSHGCRGDVCPRNIYPNCYVLDNGDSYPGLSNNVDKAVRLLFPGILVLVLLPMVIDYFNGYARAHSLGIVDQIKIMGESSLIYSGLWFCTYLRLSPRKYKIVSWKKKEFKDLKDLLVFLDFIL
jgi:hypothetical protein